MDFSEPSIIFVVPEYAIDVFVDHSFLIVHFDFQIVVSLFYRFDFLALDKLFHYFIRD